MLNRLPRASSACRYLRLARPSPSAASYYNRRAFAASALPLADGHSNSVVSREDILKDFNASINFPEATIDVKDLHETNTPPSTDNVTVHGYLGNQRNATSKLTFVELYSLDGSHNVQLKVFASTPETTALRDGLRLVRPFAPVSITGQVQPRKGASTTRPQVENGLTKISHVEIDLTSFQPLNDFPKDIIVAEGTVIPPEQRHLQLRTHRDSRDAVIFRSKVCELVRRHLCNKCGFTDVETPLLFKSTPEGAHEFLVPTRTPGHAYALPQSPQQYKQILMASGIPRYMQIAKCFRDEDQRADRQPEFTQIDIEMAFAGEDQIMRVIEDLVKTMWAELLETDLWSAPFARMTYEEAMSRYGSDKPDTRFDAVIQRIEYMLPVDLISKITHLLDPVVEVLKLSISPDPDSTRKFVSSFMDSPEAKPFNGNPHGQPGIFIYDPRKPLGGLQPFGFEAAEVLEDKLDLQEGDLVVIQARPDAPFSGGSTVTGNLRLALHKHAVNQSVLPKPTGWNFLWVTDFPLFTPADEPAPLPDTTHGTAQHPALESTHHPFTAPLPSHAHLLLSAPLEVKAAHYDLVLNGIELGGGSRRIHHAAMQRLVLADILKLSSERLAQFDHLIEVLRAGCPPHAGMALGLDRLVMLMLGRGSVRDVIAFPKGGGGVDALVKAPSVVGPETWGRYGLKVAGQ